MSKTIQQPQQEAAAGDSSLPSWTTNYMDCGQISRLIPQFSLRAIRDRASKGTMPFPMQKIGRSWYALKSDVQAYWDRVQANYAGK